MRRTMGRFATFNMEPYPYLTRCSIYYRKYILQITQPSQYRYMQLQYRFAVISEAPSTLVCCLLAIMRRRMSWFRHGVNDFISADVNTSLSWSNEKSLLGSHVF